MTDLAKGIRPGILDAVEAVRFAIKLSTGQLSATEIAQFFPTAYQGEDIRPEGVAYSWLAQFAAKILIDQLVPKGAEEYMELVSEVMYEESA